MMSKLLLCVLLGATVACAGGAAASPHVRKSAMEALYQSGEASINADPEAVAFVCTPAGDQLACEAKAGPLSPALSERLTSGLGSSTGTGAHPWTVHGVRRAGVWTATIDRGSGPEPLPVLH